MVMPDVSSYTWMVALSPSIRMISPTSLQRIAVYQLAQAVAR